MMNRTSPRHDELITEIMDLVKFMAQSQVEHNTLVARLNAAIDSVRSKYTGHISDVERDFNDSLERLHDIVGENLSELFPPKSMQLIYGVLAARSNAGKSTLNESKLLDAAREHRKVRALFKVRVTYELRDDAKQWIADHPEETWVEDCIDEQDPSTTVSVKFSRNAPDIDGSRLTPRATHVGTYPSLPS